jgi:hypothetical protein
MALRRARSRRACGLGCTCGISLRRRRLPKPRLALTTPGRPSNACASDDRRASSRRSNGTEEVLARAMNLLIARGAYREAARMHPEDLIRAAPGRIIERSKVAPRRGQIFSPDTVRVKNSLKKRLKLTSSIVLWTFLSFCANSSCVFGSDSGLCPWA